MIEGMKCVDISKYDVVVIWEAAEASDVPEGARCQGHLMKMESWYLVVCMVLIVRGDK